MPPRRDNLYKSVFVRVTCDDPPVDVRAMLGDERPDVSSGYGGWEEVERPRRTTITTWRGQPARRLQITLLLDEWTTGRSIERQISALERIALPREGGQPPIIHLQTASGAVPWRRRKWVVDAISWGDALMNRKGNRVRQMVTLTLLQYVSDDLIERRAPSKKRRSRHGRKTGKGSKKGAKEKRRHARRGRRHRKGGRAMPRAGTVTAYDGEDLLSLAATELGDARRWREIADLNGIRDPRAITVGQVIRLP